MSENIIEVLFGTRQRVLLVRRDAVRVCELLLDPAKLQDAIDLARSVKARLATFKVEGS